MRVFVARQPIFNRVKKAVAYELLFRDGLQNAFPKTDGDYATSKLLMNVYTSLGIDEIAANKLIFVNFTERLLLNRIPLMFPRDRLVIEILEDVEVTEDVLSACDDFLKNNYKIALDDFFFKKDVQSLIEKSHIIKIDYRQGEVPEIVQRLKNFKKILLAEKIETEEEFQEAFNMGFRLFQGYFFSKPQIIEGEDIPPTKLNLLLVITEIHKEQWDVRKIEEYIKRDPALTYKLLRYINSAFFAMNVKVENIKKAITLLGEKQIKTLISLIMLAETVQGKPNELILNTIITAKLCENIAKNINLNIDPEQAFTTGIFAYIDAILDKPKEVILDKLPLHQEIKSALLGADNPLGLVLKTAKGYLMGDWASLIHCSNVLNIDEKILPELYFYSLKWANAFESSV